MKISVMSYSFNKMAAQGKLNLFGYLESCKYRFGLQTADIWANMLPGLEADDLKKVREALDERELVLTNLAIDQADLWVADAAQRQANYQMALKFLHVAEVLGAKTVRMNTGGNRDDLDWSTEQFDYVAARWQEYARIARERGFRVGPENHWGPEQTPAGIKKLCEAVNNPAFGVVLHFARWKGANAEKGDELTAPWAIHTHIPPVISEETLQKTMTMLRDKGYQGYWSIEAVVARYSETALWVARVRDILEQWQS